MTERTKTDEILDERARAQMQVPGAAAAPSLDDILGGGVMTDEDYQRIADQKYYISQFIPQGGIVFMHAEPGHAKSWLAFVISDWILTNSPGTEVWYIDMDSGVIFTKKRVNILRKKYNERFKYVSQAKSDVTKERANIKLLADYSKAKTLDLSRSVFVVDSLLKFTGGNINESNKVIPFTNDLEAMRNAGATIILIHHNKKAKDDDGKGVFMGSQAILSAIDVQYSVTLDKKTNHIECEVGKTRGDYVSHTVKIKDFNNLQAEHIGYISREERQEMAQEKREAFEHQTIYTWVKMAEDAGKPILKQELEEKIRKEIDRKRNQARAIIKRLIEEGVIREGFGTGRATPIRIAHKPEGAEYKNADD